MCFNHPTVRIVLQGRTLSGKSTLGLIILKALKDNGVNVTFLDYDDDSVITEGRLPSYPLDDRPVQIVAELISAGKL